MALGIGHHDIDHHGLSAGFEGDQGLALVRGTAGRGSRGGGRGPGAPWPAEGAGGTASPVGLAIEAEGRGGSGAGPGAAFPAPSAARRSGRLGRAWAAVPGWGVRIRLCREQVEARGIGLERRKLRLFFFRQWAADRITQSRIRRVPPIAGRRERARNFARSAPGHSRPRSRPGSRWRFQRSGLVVRDRDCDRRRPREERPNRKRSPVATCSRQNGCCPRCARWPGSSGSGPSVAATSGARSP